MTYLSPGDVATIDDGRVIGIETTGKCVEDLRKEWECSTNTVVETNPNELLIVVGTQQYDDETTVYVMYVRSTGRTFIVAGTNWHSVERHVRRVE